MSSLLDITVGDVIESVMTLMAELPEKVVSWALGYSDYSFTEILGPVLVLIMCVGMITSFFSFFVSDKSERNRTNNGGDAVYSFDDGGGDGGGED